MTSFEPWVERILRVADHVHAHLEEPLDPGELAQVAGLSLHHFHRVFRGMTGESLMAFVRRSRLERAALRLKYSSTPVTTVALNSGYQSHEAFTRAFRGQFGLSPHEFRKEAVLQTTDANKFVMGSRVERRVLAVRHTGPYEECLQAWERLATWTKEAGLFDKKLESLGLCYEDPDVTEASKLRYDACLAFPAELISQYALPADIRELDIPGGTYATALHEGSYESILETYVALLGHWLPQRDIELADEPVVEIYLTSPFEVPEEDLRTAICVRTA